ncbi:hypothetical protein AXF42_Ash000727 [Apostasia shenzhenica]|uniref:Methyltransferase small domain-containing protein n=1 Tax=Apostasia shenzhenica TaxID=1088818 RepID=A0A2I0AH68_9ASPA|nr:hypothetical protein AXF42_Ash000727 [Apostasia shenzhenica]
MALLLRPPTVAAARCVSRHRRIHQPVALRAKVVATDSPSFSHENPILHLEPASSSSSSVAVLQCQHFRTCSGCSQEWDLDRPHVVGEASRFFRELGVSDFIFESGKLWEWRCRAKLVVRGTSERPLIGLYKEGTHDIVDIPQCRGISALNIQPYDEDLGSDRHSLKLISFCIMLPLSYTCRNENSESSEKLNALAGIIFGNRWRHLLGERDFWEHIGGIDISLDPFSFGQANSQAFNSLLRKLQKYVPYGSSVVDLYAGAGAIGLSLAATRKCRQEQSICEPFMSVRCVEINRESKSSFEKTLSRLPKYVDCSIHWHSTDASSDPLHWLKGSDVVIVDPPRKGLDQSLLDALRVISFQKVPKAHRRYLISGNAWHLEKAHAFNLFPGTQSIEVLAVFKRGPKFSAKNKKAGKKKKS